MPPFRIAIVRSADGLHELVHDVQAPARETPWRIAATCTLRPYVPERGTKLAAAWPALAAVTAWDEATMWHVYTVLLDTVPSGDDAGELAALGDVAPPEPPRATAAHPRAYRGTKAKPPKPARPQPVDVRRYLLARRHVEQVLAQLPSVVPELLGSDVYARIWFTSDRRGSTSALEPWFATHVLPLLTSSYYDGDWSQVMAFHATARAFALGDDKPLRDALIGILVEIARDGRDRAAARARALAWWQHVLAQDARLDAAQLVLASGVWRRDPDGLAEVLAACTEMDQRWDVHRRFAIGQSPAYLLGGLSLRHGLGVPRAWQTRATPIGDVAPLVRDVVARLGEAARRDSGPDFWRGRLWEMCGEAPAMVRLLASPALTALTPEAAFWLLRLAGSAGYDDDAPDRYAALASAAREIATRAAAVAPAYQLKVVELAARVAYWTDDAGELGEAIASALPLAERVARAPFATASSLKPLLVRLRDIPAPVAAAFFGAPDASLVALEEACRRDNDARIVATGVFVLLEMLPDFTIASFAACPRALLRVADALAAISRAAAREVLAAYARTPLATDLAGASLPELVAAIAPAVAGPGRRGPDPIRRALREHLAGTRELSPEQLRGHRARLVAALPAVRLAAIHRMAGAALAARAKLAHAESPSLRHALALLDEVDENRRPLRKLLVAFAAGDATWRLRHPLTEAWFARHRELDRARWLAGASITRAIPGLGDVTFATEHDPLEVLRVGTYVGTCLGRGGAFAYSAAAIALDANKHVVYARDARGDVVGRQLIAVSEQGELVCFYVYGKSNHEKLEAAFAELDRTFAAALGLPIHRGDAGYTIATILAQRSWDDSAWELPSAE